ncbi:MAG: DNA polymerase/3'-5' exonuclease PolX [Cytophagales bacterium]|nr:DNA polymerase/3'-5' exonuclease PolX [Cytophagales bacterium]
MNNSQIIQQFKLMGSLLELHQANSFQVRAYQKVADNLGELQINIIDASPEELTTIGLGKKFLDKIEEIKGTGTFHELADLLAKTPKGVIDMLNIKGIGAKKIYALWKELGLESLDALLTACENDEVTKLKGFAKKTQENIAQQILFMKAQQGKALYADVEQVAYELEKTLQAQGLQVQLVGEIVRRLEIVEKIQYIIGHENPQVVFKTLNSLSYLQQNKNSGLFTWRGKINNTSVEIECKIVNPKKFYNEIFIHSSSIYHLRHQLKNQESLLTFAKNIEANSEEEIYKKAFLPYYIPEIREGDFEFKYTQDNPPPSFIETNDLKGTLHNHSTYSDGKNTLSDMADYCQELGYQYLGISDHSKTAFYANGLSEERLVQQHQEIDELNSSYNNFKIFKGIESDILGDGSLDYADDVLANFDFIVASIHSGLSMTEKKATERLITAIENPYTTILGHPTGRLLLRREGYPINHAKIIDACAENNVCIEINANPWRLDIDWRWVNYALEKNVLISINPDAHINEGLLDMYYGTLVGRKGGLTKEMTLNSFSLEEISEYFNKQKSKR